MNCRNPYSFPMGNKSGVPGGLVVPCGSCIPCQINRARFWSVRCHFESLEHANNLFITLTYNDEHLPPDNKLCTRDVQLFFKRYRKALGKTKIRYFGCGEYGPANARPHYHFLIFGGDFTHENIIKTSWPNGFVQVQMLAGGLNHIMYVTKYNLKPGGFKTSAELRHKLYCSRRPGIGASALPFFEKLYKQNLEFNSVKIDGQNFPIPRYYLKQFIDEEAKKEYMLNNSIFFNYHKDEYLSLVKGKVDRIEARAKLRQRKDL